MRRQGAVQPLTVDLQYSVKRAVNGEGKPTFSLVTIDLKGAKSKNSIQTLTLVFAQSDVSAAAKQCALAM